MHFLQFTMPVTAASLWKLIFCAPAQTALLIWLPLGLKFACMVGFNQRRNSCVRVIGLLSLSIVHVYCHKRQLRGDDWARSRIFFLEDWDIPPVFNLFVLGVCGQDRQKWRFVGFVHLFVTASIGAQSTLDPNAEALGLICMLNNAPKTFDRRTLPGELKRMSHSDIDVLVSHGLLYRLQWRRAASGLILSFFRGTS